MAKKGSKEQTSQPAIVYRPQITSTLFRQFSVFHTFSLKKLWRRPLLFSIIFLIFSLICFIGRGNTQDGVLLGSVLLVVGIGLPFCYFLNFFLSVRKTSKKMGLSKPRSAYFLEFFEDHVLIRYRSNPKTGASQPNETYLWKDIYCVIHHKNAAYLYVSPDKAFLLPDGQADHADDYVQAFYHRVLTPAQIRN